MIRALDSEDRSLIEEWARTLNFDSHFNWSVESLKECLDRFQVLGVIEEGKLISALAYQTSWERWEILWLATRPEAQGRGWMQKLLQNHLHNASQCQATVGLEVHENNLKARNLYVQLGFSQLGVRKNYYRDGGNALVFIYSPPPKRP